MLQLSNVGAKSTSKRPAKGVEALSKKTLPLVNMIVWVAMRSPLRKPYMDFSDFETLLQIVE